MNASDREIGEKMAAITLLMMVCLAGGVMLHRAPSYKQQRPTREEMEQWEASLGFLDLGTRMDGFTDFELGDVVDPSLEGELVDPELVNVLDPSLEEELQPLGKPSLDFGDDDDLDREHGLLFS